MMLSLARTECIEKGQLAHTNIHIHIHRHKSKNERGNFKMSLSSPISKSITIHCTYSCQGLFKMNNSTIFKKSLKTVNNFLLYLRLDIKISFHTYLKG